MKHTSNTRPAPRISRRLWVGLIPGAPRQVFRHTGTPTLESTPQFAVVIGPFRTRRGADFMADPVKGTGNPHCRCVADAERLAAIHAGQSALCAAYSAHLDREIWK